MLVFIQAHNSVDDE